MYRDRSNLGQSLALKGSGGPLRPTTYSPPNLQKERPRKDEGLDVSVWPEPVAPITRVRVRF
jgi:hypothetical protein